MEWAEIEKQNTIQLRRQLEFRMAADVVAAVWANFAEVAAVAVIGSVAKMLWKEVPRFSDFRRARIKVWHECGDLDLALWIDGQGRLRALRKSAERALREAFEAGAGISVAGHQIDIFLFEPGSDRYLGRLCKYNQCPKAKPACAVPGCGDIAFNQRIATFHPRRDLLAAVQDSMLYRRGTGRVRSACDLPVPDADEHE